MSMIFWFVDCIW